MCPKTSSVLWDEFGEAPLAPTGQLLSNTLRRPHVFEAGRHPHMHVMHVVKRVRPLGHNAATHVLLKRVRRVPLLVADGTCRRALAARVEGATANNIGICRYRAAQKVVVRQPANGAPPDWAAI